MACGWRHSSCLQVCLHSVAWKIESAINNARRTLDLQSERSLAGFVWRFEPSHPPPPVTETEESKALSDELKAQGFTWVGPTNMHAFMQSTGLANDHAGGCRYRKAAAAARASFVVPVT